MYATIKFFQGRDRAFLAWLGNYIRPIIIQEQDTIFMEGEAVLEMFFIVKGKAAFVIPTYNNTICQEFNQGEHFG
jgi:hypothetical protein